MHSLISKAVRRISGITAQTASTASGGVYEKAFNMRFHQKQKPPISERLSFTIFTS
jgi:hypothetical protein